MKSHTDQPSSTSNEADPEFGTQGRDDSWWGVRHDLWSMLDATSRRFDTTISKSVEGAVFGSFRDFFNETAMRERRSSPALPRDEGHACTRWCDWAPCCSAVLQCCNIASLTLCARHRRAGGDDVRSVERCSHCKRLAHSARRPRAGR